MKWVKTKDRMPPDGRYYVKVLYRDKPLLPGGGTIPSSVSSIKEIGKQIETIEDGKWMLGSAFFIIESVEEWLDESEDDLISESQP